MTIDEAIKELSLIIREGCEFREPDERAFQLGIEALERVKYNSTARFGEYDYSPLPSETEDIKRR